MILWFGNSNLNSTELLLLVLKFVKIIIIYCSENETTSTQTRLACLIPHLIYRYNDEIVSGMNFNLRYILTYTIIVVDSIIYLCANKNWIAHNKTIKMNASIYLNKRFCVFSFALLWILFVCARTIKCIYFCGSEKVIQIKMNERMNKRTNNRKTRTNEWNGVAAVAMLPINTLEKYFHCKQLNRMNF